MVIATDAAGNVLESFDDVSEGALLHAALPCPLALVVVTGVDGGLFGLNASRKTWELPGGMLEPDESPREAAARELAEETSVRIAPAVLAYEGAATFTLQNPDRRELAAIYSAPLPDGSVPSTSDELIGIRWMDPPAESGLSLDARIAAWVVARHEYGRSRR